MLRGLSQWPALHQAIDGNGIGNYDAKVDSVSEGIGAIGGRVLSFAHLRGPLLMLMLAGAVPAEQGSVLGGDLGRAARLPLPPPRPITYPPAQCKGEADAEVEGDRAACRENPRTTLPVAVDCPAGHDKSPKDPGKGSTE